MHRAISIKRHDDFPTCHAYSRVERRALASVLLILISHWNCRSIVIHQIVLLEKTAHLLLHAISRAIIDHNHFHVGVCAGYRRLERRNESYFFVVGRDNDRNHRLVCYTGTGLSCLHFPPEKPYIVPG